MERIGKRFREFAGRNLRERRANLEKRNEDADPIEPWGRLLSLSQKNEADSESSGVGATACGQKGRSRNTGSPRPQWSVHKPEARESQTGRSGMAERLVVPQKPGNAGGGKGPQFKGQRQKGRATGE